MGLPGRERSLDDMFSRLDTMHQDRQIDIGRQQKLCLRIASSSKNSANKQMFAIFEFRALMSYTLEHHCQCYYTVQHYVRTV